MTSGSWRQTWVEVDLDAIENNVRVLRSLVGAAALCTVVKADGYGHGSVPIAASAMAAGASWLAVALVEEGVVLREAGITAPVLLLSEPPRGSEAVVIEHQLTPTVYSSDTIAALDMQSVRLGRVTKVHLKVDTGMHRVGVQPTEALSMARLIDAAAGLQLEGVYTHFANADEPDDPYTDEQSVCFDRAKSDIEATFGPLSIAHTANTSATLTREAEHRDLVRVGVATYGVAPSLAVPLSAQFRPAMSIRSRVSFVQRHAAGERVSYGLRYQLRSDANLAVVPIGYADGIPRLLGQRGGEVLIRGQRFAMAGNITMDQLVVDCGDTQVEVGDEVVLLGNQGDEAITASDLAQRVDSVDYEFICQIGPRLPRRYLGGSMPSHGGT